MLAQAHTNCNDIEKIVSAATQTHLAKIGVTQCVVGDIAQHVSDISS